MSFADECRDLILEKLRDAERAGLRYIDLRAGDLHTELGDYPGPNHRMPVCCYVMRELMKGNDEVLQEPPKGKGANLVIRYYLPR